MHKPRNRLSNKKEERRLKRRMLRKQEFADLTRIRILAGELPDQAALDSCLLQCKDPIRRKALFDFMEPFLKFPNPEFPSELERSRIIRP